MSGTLAKKKSRHLGPVFRHGGLSPWREGFEDLLSRFWGDEEEAFFAGQMVASMDMAETDKTVEVRLDLPGVKPENVDIQLNAGTLTVRGERKEEEEEEDKERNYHRMERRYGSFSRSVTLPCLVREDEAAAAYKDGVLTITLPKSEEAKTRRIKVKS